MSQISFLFFYFLKTSLNYYLVLHICQPEESSNVFISIHAYIYIYLHTYLDEDLSV